jgi:FkbM family methyltransferase
MSAARVRQIVLAFTVLLAAAAALWKDYNLLFLAVLIGALGLLTYGCTRRAGLLALPLVALGLFLSILDPSGCSVWGRGRIVYLKLAGGLPYMSWHNVGRDIFYPQALCHGDPPSVQLLEGRSVNGHKIERYRTSLGDFWIPASHDNVISWLLWELTVQNDYADGNVDVHAGDVVVDCGAHVGTFTRYALLHGAKRVVAIEPEPTNLACLEANLTEEIAGGRVTVVKGGVWDQPGRLTLWSGAESNSAAASFVRQLPQASATNNIPVFLLDDLVEQLRLNRVDFIKMDIEGSERHALAGAAKTLRRFRPRMAICVYHLRDDPTVIPAVVRSAQPAYRIESKDLETDVWIRPKVLFFE